ncbi:MAG: hypothetical protein Q7T05_05925 [Dehalococcoidia bacterium]|nr:hypothetical protein [Dehalococcoidia bacterium]
MVTGAEWSEAEFAVMMDNSKLSDPVLAGKLPGRSVQEIAAVRDIIHDYHTGTHVTGLPMRVIIPRLKRGSWTCQRCGKKC